MSAAASIGWRLWSPAACGVGESPMWDTRSNTLYWLDLFGPSLSASASPNGPVRSWTLPSMPGCYALAGPSDAVVALDSGIVHLDLDGGRVTPLVTAPYDLDRFRFSDGRCDGRGRLWVGTNRQPGSGQPRGSSAFYRLDDRGLVRMFDGVTISNGLAFSPDGARMYFADTVEDTVWVCDYDEASGKASGRRLFASVQPGAMPDGAAVDADGYYWVAMYGAGCVVRFAPDGREDRVLETPVHHPTMVAFGGPDLGKLFLTSARKFADEAVVSREPLIGGVFTADVGVRGQVEPRFAHLDTLLAPTAGC